MTRLNDLPRDELPREKMLKRGSTSLSDAELLALFLRTGTQNRNAIGIGQDLIEKFGSLTALGRLDLNQLTQEHGIGLAKACQLTATFELGSRVARENIHRITLDTPQKIYDHLSPQMAHLKTESLRLLLLDSRLKLIAIEEISHGSVSETVAHPRDILRPAILHQCECFILAHNHPSGDPTPSSADQSLTSRLQKAAQLLGIQLNDHLIIGRPSPDHAPYYSFKEHREL